MTSSITTREPMQLTHQNVEEVFKDCLADSAAHTLKGVLIEVAFNSEKIEAHKEARQREIDSQMEVYNVRLQSALLWEKRRYEIAKDCYCRMIDETRADETFYQLAELAVKQADSLIEALKGASK